MARGIGAGAEQQEEGKRPFPAWGAHSGYFRTDAYNFFIGYEVWIEVSCRRLNMEIRRILFPVDLTESSSKIVPQVAYMTNKFNAELHLLFVADALYQYFECLRSDVWGGLSRPPAKGFAISTNGRLESLPHNNGSLH